MPDLDLLEDREEIEEEMLRELYLLPLLFVSSAHKIAVPAETPNSVLHLSYWAFTHCPNNSNAIWIIKYYQNKVCR